MKPAPRVTSPLASREHTVRTIVASIGIIMVTGACAGASHASRPYMPSASSRLGIEEMTRGDLSAANSGSSLYTAIRYLRPRLLDFRYDGRGVATPATPIVYVDGIRAGEIELLESIPINRVRKVEFLPADDRRPYGYRYEPGAILVTLTADRP